MNNAAAVVDASPTTLTSREQGPRFELYRAPHKALRLLTCELLLAMGRTSFGDELQAFAIASALEVVLRACDGHIHHEDRFVRPALLERTPKAVATLDGEHDEHATQVAELRALAKALKEAASSDHRASIGRTLYLHYSVFVAETLAHMAYEERVVQPLLDRHFTFEEQMGIHLSIVKSIEPEEMMSTLRAMIPAANREERVEILNGGRRAMPEPAFKALVNDLVPLLSAADGADLIEKLGV